MRREKMATKPGDKEKPSPGSQTTPTKGAGERESNAEAIEKKVEEHETGVKWMLNGIIAAVTLGLAASAI